MANNAVSEIVTIAYWCNLGFEKFHRVASSSTKVGTCEKIISIYINTIPVIAFDNTSVSHT